MQEKRKNQVADSIGKKSVYGQRHPSPVFAKYEAIKRGRDEVLIRLYYFCSTINQKTRLEISKRVFLCVFIFK